jgi:zinc D-Ala-D-Ala carboxypeptidase
MTSDKETARMGDLTRSFSRNEFACPCCGKDDISLLLVTKLQGARDALAIPFMINSGVRCEKHNREKGGKDNSAHLRGMAADIACSDSHTRYKMVQYLIGKFARLEVGSTWIHVDVDESLPQEVLFLP